MLYVSQFVPDRSRFAEFLACLWQGDIPAGLRLRSWLYRAEGMFLVWEGDDDARGYVERAFGSFGDLSTEEVTDSTPGLAACFARDLDGFGEWMRQRGTGGDELARQLDVRRRGLEAATQEDAYAAGAAWAREQTGG
jgi:hypothetical protein